MWDLLSFEVGAMVLNFWVSFLILYTASTSPRCLPCLSGVLCIPQFVDLWVPAITRRAPMAWKKNPTGQDPSICGALERGSSYSFRKKNLSIFVLVWETFIPEVTALHSTDRTKWPLVHQGAISPLLLLFLFFCGGWG